MGRFIRLFRPSISIGSKEGEFFDCFELAGMKEYNIKADIICPPLIFFIHDPSFFATL